MMQIAIYSLFLIGGAQADPAGEIIPKLRECKSVVDDQSRLRCLDTVLETLTPANKPVVQKSEGKQAVAQAETSSEEVSEPTIAALPVREPAVMAETELFGAEDLPSKERDKKDDRPKALSATLIELAKNKSGKYVIILDNGQVWRQLKSDTGRLSIGRNEVNIPVTIKRRSLGGYAFSLERDKRSVKVERIK